MSTPENDTVSWRDLAEQLTEKQVEWLTELESENKPGDELLNAARKLASTRHERHSVTAALEMSGLEAECHEHHLRMAQTRIGVMGLEGLTTTELVVLDAILAPAHARFLRRERRAGSKRRAGVRR